MKTTFTVFWKDGKSEVVEGTDFLTALSDAGYTNSSAIAIDFSSEGDVRKNWSYYPDEKMWKSTYIERTEKDLIIELIEKRIKEIDLDIKTPFQGIEYYDGLIGAINELESLLHEIKNI